MSYYEKIAEYVKRGAEYEKRGIDYDLRACMENNGAASALDDISRALAVVEGENDGESWHWILRLKDGRFAYMEGWCDYTGWDCQSGSTDYVCPTIAEALAHVGDDGDSTRLELARQLLSYKVETWREKMDGEFGLKTDA